jgi:IS5 family transposase
MIYLQTRKLAQIRYVFAFSNRSIEGSAKGRQKDCDTRWAKMNNETHYGYKNHVKVGTMKKLFTNYETTGANVGDSWIFDKLVVETDEAVLANSAYLSERQREITRVQM